MEVARFGQVPPGIALPTPLYDLEGVRASELVRNEYFVVEEVAFMPGARYLGWCEGRDAGNLGLYDGRGRGGVGGRAARA